MSRQRRFTPLPLTEAPKREDGVPNAHDLRTALLNFVGSSTGTAYGAPRNASVTRVQILKELVSRHPGLTPLPAIVQHAAMYPPRVSELREDLRTLGFTIQCYEERVCIPGTRFKQNRTFYRIERRSAAQDERDFGYKRVQDDRLFASGRLALDYEMGRVR